MKKILLSLLTVSAVAAVAFAGTRAFFSDTETSTGNVFTAGAIDLRLANTSYVSNQTTGALEASSGTSWTLKDLTVEKFFNFSDVKPGDVGEDTIELNVNNNDAWVCADLTLTTNKDNGCTEPESKDDGTCNPQSTDLWDGELAQGIEFVWWADDGDNVLEVDEEATKYYLGPKSIKELLGDDNKLELTVADSVMNFYKLQHPNGGPLTGARSYFIGKGWCFGDMTLTPLAQDPTGTPLTRGTGFSCNGAAVNNATQTDSLTADLTFTAIQARNNMSYKCPEHQPKPIRITSSNLNYGPTGWAGWSCPAGTHAVGGGVIGNTYPMGAQGIAETGAVIGGSTYPTFPHYTFGAGETGYVAQNGGTGQTVQIYVDCLAN